jgi:hypothetical protein
MPAQQVDALMSFTHLVDNIPSWLTRLEELSQYTSEKNKAFIAEYARLVKTAKPKRLKSPSITSIHSNKNAPAHLPDIDPSDDNPQEIAVETEINPLEAGTRHIYAEQVQRKRKGTASLRSEASGPQKFRTKQQVVIHYDSHVQDEFDTMVKDIGIARNYLRKGKMALTANRGFRLPNLPKRYEALASSSLENIRTMSKSRSTSNSASIGKLNLRTMASQNIDENDADFINADKILEQVQMLYETAAHQFLRDGDCKKELDGARSKLTGLKETAKATAESLKLKQQAADEATVDDSTNVSRRQSTSEKDCPSLLTDKSSMEPLTLPSVPKGDLSALNQTLEDLRAQNAKSTAPALESVPQGAITIEVDDGSDNDSLGEIDLSQFRSAARLRLRN